MIFAPDAVDAQNVNCVHLRPLGSKVHLRRGGGSRRWLLGPTLSGVGPTEFSCRTCGAESASRAAGLSLDPPPSAQRRRASEPRAWGREKGRLSLGGLGGTPLGFGFFTPPGRDPLCGSPQIALRRLQ